jgi:hypothetical protein
MMIIKEKCKLYGVTFNDFMMSIISVTIKQYLSMTIKQYFISKGEEKI